MLKISKKQGKFSKTNVFTPLHIESTALTENVKCQRCKYH